MAGRRSERPSGIGLAHSRPACPAVPDETLPAPAPPAPDTTGFGIGGVEPVTLVEHTVRTLPVASLAAELNFGLNSRGSDGLRSPRLRVAWGLGFASLAEAPRLSAIAKEPPDARF